jgi:hypothetical protein
VRALGRDVRLWLWLGLWLGLRFGLRFGLGLGLWLCKLNDERINARVRVVCTSTYQQQLLRHYLMLQVYI